jgi:hypothetical protein
MDTRLDSESQFSHEGHRVSAIGFRLRVLRKQIKAAAERGETTLYGRDELDSELESMRKRDSNVS